jgi:hypothetical protein
MRVQFNADAQFSAADEKLFDRRIDRLRRRLGRQDGDHVMLTIQVESTPRTGDYVGSARLAVRDGVFIAQRNVGETVGSLIAQMFDDLERQLGSAAARRRDLSKRVATMA